MDASRFKKNAKPERKPHSLTKYILLFTAVCALMGIGLVIGNAFSRKLPTVATVNGYPITVREVQTRLTDGRGYIRSYFEQKYDVIKEDASFWDRDFEGITPMEYGREYYYEESIRIKVVQILAKELGLTQDISYETFLSRLDEENDRRAQAAANGRPVSGLLQYGEADLFEMELATLEDALLDKLVSNNTLSVTEGEMKAYFEENREKFFKIAEDYTFEVVTAVISPTSENGEDPVAKAAMQSFADRLKAGEPFEKLTQEVEAGKFEGLTYSVITVGSGSETDMLEHEKVFALKDKIKSGELALNEVSGVLTSPFYYYSIGRCTEFQDNGYADFQDETVRNNILNTLQIMKYQDYVQQQVENATIELDLDAYAQIALPEKYR